VTVEDLEEGEHIFAGSRSQQVVSQRIGKAVLEEMVSQRLLSRRFSVAPEDGEDHSIAFRRAVNLEKSISDTQPPKSYELPSVYSFAANSAVAPSSIIISDNGMLPIAAACLDVYTMIGIENTSISVRNAITTRMGLKNKADIVKLIFELVRTSFVFDAQLAEIPLAEQGETRRRK
jgi:hypothetical protein